MIKSDQPQKRSSSKRPSTSSIAGYIGVFLLVITLVAIGYQPPEQIKVMANAASVNTTNGASSSDDKSAVSDLVATQVASTIAESADLPVAANVANLSQSMAAESVLSQTDNNIVAKPQIVQASADSRSIKTYTTVAGDTVPALASKFGISADTIRWANNLKTDALDPGTALKILPVDGILYTIKSSDTIESVASHYKANVDEIRTYNDLELGGFTAGKQIIIPDGDLPANERPGYVAPVYNNSGYSNTGSAASNNYSATVGNRYAFGNCTWYVYERRSELGSPVGSFWGNAATWSYYASAAGYKVDYTPSAGAVMQNGGGVGHVAIVESVNPGVSVTISEMNAARFGGGFNRIDRGDISWSVATSGMYKYIH